MAQKGEVMKTKIEWATDVWNPVTGCTKISPGCKNCYAERMAKRLAGRCGYPADEPFRVTLHPERLEEPLHWKKPRRVFVCSMGDLFHADVPSDFILQVWHVMNLSPQHTFMILTKRAARMEMIMNEWLPSALELSVGLRAKYKVLPNVWLGVTAENQEQADKRIPLLLQTPAAVRFVSVEPMLGAVALDVSYGQGIGAFFIDSLDWVICGGESGPGARPMNPDWARDLRDQCQAAGVPFFFKQWGEWVEVRETTQEIVEQHSKETRSFPNGDLFFRVGKKAAGRLLDGRTWDEYPA